MSSALRTGDTLDLDLNRSDVGAGCHRGGAGAGAGNGGTEVIRCPMSHPRPLASIQIEGD